MRERVPTGSFRLQVSRAAPSGRSGEIVFYNLGKFSQVPRRLETWCGTCERCDHAGLCRSGE